jgi:putative two-component system response regulator
MNVLIADDDEISRELLEHMLVGAGYNVLAVDNGAAALTAIREGDYRLVVSDWDMPGMSGMDLCRAVRNEDANGYIYMILLTTHCGPEAIVEGMSAGADDFMSKPFHPQELLVRLRAGERVLALETREMVIFALARLAESRDPETGHHLERVQRYSRVLAQQLALNERLRGQIDAEFIRLVYLTSPLHDIGKVGIPDAVLLKPGRLSDEEFEIMKMHTLLGAQTLDAALEKYPEARFLKMARAIAAHHHERYDGSGYPMKLAGEDIPLCARIVSLADVYDALTSKRVYKAAFSHTVARNIIVKDSGTHFDPDVVEAFLQQEETFRRIQTEFSSEPEEPLWHKVLSQPALV